jgi:hypothetical protein
VGTSSGFGLVTRKVKAIESNIKFSKGTDTDKKHQHFYGVQVASLV